jgi:hypothetical protein
MERNVLKERLMNKNDKNRHYALLIIDRQQEMVNKAFISPKFMQKTNE